MSSSIQTCPHCDVMVVPRPDGECPACHRNFNSPPVPSTTEKRRGRETFEGRPTSLKLIGPWCGALLMGGILGLLRLIPATGGGGAP